MSYLAGASWWENDEKRWPFSLLNGSNKMGVSKNRGGPPKWMVKIMENPIKMDDLGGFTTTPIFGNTQMSNWLVEHMPAVQLLVWSPSLLGIISIFSARYYCLRRGFMIFFIRLQALKVLTPCPPKKTRSPIVVYPSGPSVQVDQRAACDI